MPGFRFVKSRCASNKERNRRVRHNLRRQGKKRNFLSNHGCAVRLSFFGFPEDKYYFDGIQYHFNRMHFAIVAALFLVTLSGKRLKKTTAREGAMVGDESLAWSKDGNDNIYACPVDALKGDTPGRIALRKKERRAGMDTHVSIGTECW